MSRERKILALRARLLRDGLSINRVAQEEGVKGVTARAAVGRYWGMDPQGWPEEGTQFRRILDRMVRIVGRGKKGQSKKEGGEHEQ